MSLFIEDFRSIVLENRPLLDVRAPVEFSQGSFENATNIPILNDEERRLVGTRYKEEGNEAAVALAEELIAQEGKEQRVALWRSFIEENPTAYLYCFRGGQRSAIAQEWLKEAGIEIPRLKGGYKKFRNFLMEESLRLSATINTIIVGGRTGSGKTIFLQDFENFVDLEGLANHRGSSFGNTTQKQPAQIDFENALAYKLIEAEAKGFKTILIEHESHNIGKAFIPKAVFNNLMNGKLVILERAMSERLEIIYTEYVLHAIQEHEKLFAEDGFVKWKEGVLVSLKKIKKRLGSELYLELESMFEAATLEQEQESQKKLLKIWIEKLLTHYYDSMYDYQLEKTAIPIIFRGSAEELASVITHS